MEQVILDHIDQKLREKNELISLFGKYPNFIETKTGISSNFSNYDAKSLFGKVFYGVIIGDCIEGIKLKFSRGKIQELCIFVNGFLIDEIAFYENQASSKGYHLYYQYIDGKIIKTTVKYWDEGGNRRDYV